MKSHFSWSLRMLSFVALVFIFTLLVGTNTASAQCDRYRVTVFYFNALDFPSGINVTANWGAPNPSTNTNETNVVNGDVSHPLSGPQTLISATVFGVTVNMGNSGHACVQVRPGVWVCVCISLFIDPDGCPHIHLAECSQSADCSTKTCP
jgi:hypothetical protein